jgi:SAM-dependent methyltransferase
MNRPAHGSNFLARGRLYPHPWQADYVQLRALTTQMGRRIAARWPPGAGIRVADVGCGDRPYEPLFSGRAADFVGIDLFESPRVDVVASADALPFEDREFDCVLAIGVLQYVSRPLKALEESWRILRPGGALFLSAHGIGFTDRGGPDRWRWTQQGLRSLFEQMDGWRQLEVLPAGGVMCAAAYLIGGQMEFAAHRAGLPRLSAPFCLALNALSWQADRAARLLYPALPPDASVNFLAVAERD